MPQNGDRKEHCESEDTALGSFLDVAKLQQLVVKDELTRLYNRRYFRHRLDEECRRWKRQKRPFSLMMADVDDFKEINDRFGHPVGDRALVEIAGVLATSIRDIDVVCRYAGDEFVFILPGVEEDECRNVAVRIDRNMSGHPWKTKLEVPIPGVSVSTGYAVFPDDADEIDELIDKADKALYFAKKMSRPFKAYSEAVEAGFTDRKDCVNNESLPVIGRKKERKELLGILDLAAGGAGQFVLIRGDLGMGKTQILTEVEEKAAAKGFSILKGNCFPETKDIPFCPLIQVVESVFEKSDNSFLIEEMPEPWREEVRSVLRREKGRGDGVEEEKGLRDEQNHEEFRMYETFSSFLNTISSSRSIMISLENLQWVDPSSLRLLKYLGRKLRDRGVLICGTIRDGDVRNVDASGMALQQGLQLLNEESFLREICLSGLKEVEIYALIDKKMSGARLDPAFKEKIVHLSEGNPLFAQEILNYLYREKQDLIANPQSSDQVTLDDIIPPNIVDLFARNLAGLDSEVKSILSYASVIGHEFDFSVLMAISGKNEGYLLDIIDLAVSAGLIKECGTVEDDRYVFTPLLTSSFLYKSLGQEKRRVLHKKVGEVLELIHAKSLSNYYGVLSNHFQKAGELKKAIHYASLAGKRAREVYAYREAVRFYTSALEMLDEAFVPYPHDRAAVFFEKRGKRLFALGEYPEYMDDFHAMLKSGREAARKDLEAKAMVYISSSLSTRGNLEEARRWAESALKIGRDLEDKSIMMLALTELGGVTLYLGQHERALDCYEESLQLSSELKDDKAATRVLSNIGVYHWFVGNYNEAVKFFLKALKRLEKNGDKQLLSLNLNNLGAVYYSLGRIKESVRAYQESIVLSREIKNRALLAYNYNNLGEIYQVFGLVDEALSYHKNALKIVKEVGERYVECDILRNIGVDLHLGGETVRGLRFLKNSLRFSRKVGKNDFTWNSLFDLGNAWLDNGDLSKAEMICEELIRLADESGTPVFQARASLLAARVLNSKGKRAEALVEVEKSLGLLPRAGNLLLLQHAYVLKWDITEDADDAAEALSKAVRVVREILSGLQNQELKNGYRSLGEVEKILSAAGVEDPAAERREMVDKA